MEASTSGSGTAGRKICRASFICDNRCVLSCTSGSSGCPTQGCTCSHAGSLFSGNCTGTSGKRS